MNCFQGKVAIITGAGSGIGKALAEKLAARGATLVLADVNKQLVTQTADKMIQAGYQARAVNLDVSDRDAVRTMVEDTIAEHDRLDYMFNNAGIATGGEARDVSSDDWKRVIDINRYGVIHGVCAAYPIMVRQGFGHIVNTASLAGLTPFPGELSYIIVAGKILTHKAGLAIGVGHKSKFLSFRPKKCRNPLHFVKYSLPRFTIHKKEHRPVTPSHPPYQDTLQASETHLAFRHSVLRKNRAISC